MGPSRSGLCSARARARGTDLERSQNEALTRYDCNGAGEHETIRIEVSDDEFQHCVDAWTVDVSCFGAELGETDGSGGIEFATDPRDTPECDLSLDLR